MKGAIMTYAIFNLASGNLIESYRSEKRALELVADMLEDEDNDPDSIGVVTYQKGKAVRTLSGEDLRAAAVAYGHGVTA